jgi:spore coat polysaccharide biosynthesis protein SpsF (cytidylyltransferase family)
MKTINKLPELWSIKITENNLEVLNNWRSVKGALSISHINDYLLNNPHGYTGFYVNKSDFFRSHEEKYTIISYKDFQKFILNTEIIEKPSNMKYLIKLFKKYNIK